MTKGSATLGLPSPSGPVVLFVAPVVGDGHSVGLGLADVGVVGVVGGVVLDEVRGGMMPLVVEDVGVVGGVEGGADVPAVTHTPAPPVVGAVVVCATAGATNAAAKTINEQVTTRTTVAFRMVSNAGPRVGVSNTF